MKMPQKTPARFRLAAAGLILLCSVPALRADYSNTVGSFGPLAYWRFNESVSSPPLNTISNVSTLGRAADGYAIWDLATGVPGKVGNAALFSNPGNNVSWGASKVDVPYTAAINPAVFSVEFWANPNSLGGDATGFCPISNFTPNGNSGASRLGWLVYLNNTGRWEFRLGLVSGYAGVLSATSGNATPGTWQHIVATYDGLTNRLYVDGNLVGSLAVNAGTSGWKPNFQSVLRMGATPLSQVLLTPATVRPSVAATGVGGQRGYDGYLDEVAIYGSALTPAQVGAHYAAATTNAAGYTTQILADNPVAYWPMNQPAVTPPAPSTFPLAANSGSVGSAADGTNLWGTLAAQNGPPYAGMAGGNKAVYFDGANGSVGLPDAPGLHFSGNITLMAWVKPEARDHYRTILARGLDEGRAETFFRISRSDDGGGGGTTTNYYEVGVANGVAAGFNLIYPGGAGNYYHAARFPIPEGDFGNWVFLVGTYDGANWNLYRNGVLAAAYPSVNGSYDTTNRWSIGSRSNPNPAATPPTDPVLFALNGLFFSGSIDEPAIFNTALSASDINTIYNSAQVSPVISRPVVMPTGVYKGSSAFFSVWAEGSPTLGYLWLSNGISTGVTATNLTLNNLSSGNLTVAVVVTNAYGSTTSSVTSLIVASKPLITQQPLPVARYAGRPFTFSVAAAGTAPISYQWKTNGVDIAGATSASYSGTASTATALNYSVLLSNEAGTSNSVSVALTVVTPPAAYGGAVIADGPIAYWRLGETSGNTGFDYYGGYDGTYFLASLGQPGFSNLDPNTAVDFEGTNSYLGLINGNPATGGIDFAGHVNFSVEAWVNAPAGLPAESTIIAKGAGNSGTSASEQFSLDVNPNSTTGDPAFRFFTRGGGDSLYEAYADVGPDGNWHHVVGVYDDSNEELRIYVDGDLRGSGGYRPGGVRASAVPVSIGSKHLGNSPAYDGTFNGTIDEVAIYSYALTGLQISNHYALAYPGTKPTITKQPVSLTVYESSPTPPSFTVGAYGEQPLIYQWKRYGTNLIDGGNIFGATTRTLTIGGDPNNPAFLIPVTLADAGPYSVSIDNTVGPITNSSVATLTVIAAPTTNVNIPGLVLHLPFDNSLSDTSGRGNHGTGRRANSVIGSFTNLSAAAPSGANPDFNYPSDGKLGQALHFRTATDNGGNGAVTNAYYVTLGDVPDLRFSTNVNFSVAYWVRFPAFMGVGDLGDLPFICTSPTSYGGAGYTFAPSYQLGSWSYSLNGNVQVYGGDFLLDDGNWHHLVHTFDRTGQAITFLNGKQVDVRATAAAGNLDTGNPVTIGQGPTGLYPEEGYYDIDEVGIWRRAITPLEAVGIYLAATLANSTFVDITPSIAAGPAANQVTVTWQAGVLQSSTSVSGPYTDVPSAASPYVDTTAGTKFYRTRY